MTKQQMKDHNTRMVGCWTGTNNRQQFKHAVYIKDYKEGSDNKYIFNCINSWGEMKKPRPQLKENDLSEVYYVSIYSEKVI